MCKSNDSKATWNIINTLMKTKKPLSGDLQDSYMYNVSMLVI